jgi:UDP-3-O-[3-hydroxymyristoyl] glucosamine N-acyltransferase
MSQTGPSSNAMTTLSLARVINAELIGCPELPIAGVEALDRASPAHVTFVRSPKFAERWPASQARVVIAPRSLKLPPFAHAERAALLVDDADESLCRVLELFRPQQPAPAPGQHPSSVVDATARVDPSAHVGPLCLIGPGAVVGPGAVLVSHVHLGANASVGQGTVLHPHVAILDRCSVGARCILHGGVVVGADGFGYIPTKGGLRKVPHIGHVEIADDVEIGASSTIDRGKFGATLIGRGTKIDNQVQVAHNCRVGRSVVICGCVGIAGSVTIEDGAMIGGGAGIADGITIGRGARIAALAGIMHDVPDGETFSGSPAVRHRDWARTQITLRRLADAAERQAGMT